jgi:hypothetical protein
MKKALCMIAFSATLACLYAQRAVLFDRIALDGDQAAAVKLIEREFNGRYSVEEWGGYVIALDSVTTVHIGFDYGKVDSIYVERLASSYGEFLALASKVMAAYGEPKGTYAHENGYNLYWWGYRKGDEYPSFDVRVSVSFEEPYKITESLFHGK